MTVLLSAIISSNSFLFFNITVFDSSVETPDEVLSKVLVAYLGGLLLVPLYYLECALRKTRPFV